MTLPHFTAASPAALPSDAAASPAGTPAAAAAFAAFFGGLLVALNWVVDTTAIDQTLMPRLLAESVGLLVAVAVLAAAAIAGRPLVRRLDAGVLAEPVVLFFAGYCCVTALSLLVAFNRSAGLTDVCRTLCTLVALAVACLLLPVVPRWRERFLAIAVLAGCGLATVGAWQILSRVTAAGGFDVRDRHRLEEVTGLMSNVNLYAGMLVLSLPWCAAAAVMLRGWWRPLAIVVAAAEAALLVILQSRGAWLAAVAAAATASVLVARRPESFGMPRRARGGILTAWGLLAAGLVATVAFAPAENPLARRVRSFFDDAAAVDAGAPREGGRLMIWRVTAEMIGDHLLTGVGAGNFTLRLPEYFVNESLDFSNVHTNWLEPHNDFLWVFSEKGLAGVLLFCGVFVAAARSLARVLFPAEPPAVSAGGTADLASRRLALAALAGLAAYLVLSAVDFPLERMTHQVSLAMLLALAAVTGREAKLAAAGAAPARLPGRGAILAVAIPAVILLGLSAAYARVALAQEKHVIVQRRAWRLGDYEGVLAASRRADTPWKTLDPLASPVAFLEGMALVQLGRTAEAIRALERAMEQNPNRMYVANNLAIQYLGVGRIDEALELFAMLCDAYPHRIEPINNFAGCLIEAGRYADAAAVLAQIPEELLTPDIRRNKEFANARAAAEEKPASE
jgi:O-antigen ligase/Flp pilus assembly protein TadD